MSLKVYTIHVRPSLREGALFDPDAILVPEGFSYLAFTFQFAWALYHRLWLAAFAMVLLGFGAVLLTQWLSDGVFIGLGINLTVSILIGAEALNMWRWTLERRGYRPAGVVLGETLEEAELRYFEKAMAEVDKNLSGVER